MNLEDFAMASAPSTTMTTILVVDDHALVRDSLVRALVADGHDVVGACRGPEEAMRLLLSLAPDVVLVDVNLGARVDGVELAEEIRRVAPSVRVAIVSMHDDDPTVRRAMEAGVAGFVSKDEPLDELLHAVRTVASGGSYLSSRLAGSVIAMMGGRSDGSHHLTNRESEILQHLARGERTSDIADALFLAEKTVKNHLTNLYGKLGVSTAAQAVAEAFQRGLVTRG
ncbi:MAG: DNA-binding NarL/FixJ family response regulator [Nitriliruptoraceae bacterium]